MLITLDALRHFAVVHSIFRPTTLKRALHRLGFVQADPIRAPAREFVGKSHFFSKLDLASIDRPFLTSVRPNYSPENGLTEPPAGYLRD